jgi:hypothetical protein
MDSLRSDASVTTKTAYTAARQARDDPRSDAHQPARDQGEHQYGRGADDGGGQLVREVAPSPDRRDSARASGWSGGV